MLNMTPIFPLGSMRGGLFPTDDDSNHPDIQPHGLRSMVRMFQFPLMFSASAAPHSPGSSPSLYPPLCSPPVVSPHFSHSSSATVRNSSPSLPTPSSNSEMSQVDKVGSGLVDWGWQVRAVCLAVSESWKSGNKRTVPSERKGKANMMGKGGESTAYEKLRWHMPEKTLTELPVLALCNWGRDRPQCEQVYNSCMKMRLFMNVLFLYL
jgi:hypothetical protein